MTGSSGVGWRPLRRDFFWIHGKFACNELPQTNRFSCMPENASWVNPLKQFRIIMYGMVNKAVQNLLLTHPGEDTWQQVKRKAGAANEIFITTQSPRDEVTSKIIGATSEVLEQSTGKILKISGRGWELETAINSYERRLTSGGRTLEEFLKNLPNFHTRVEMMFPTQQPPRVDGADVNPTELQLQYRSDLHGFSSLIIRQLEGLAEMFALELRITQEEGKDGGANHDVIQIAWKEPKAP